MEPFHEETDPPQPAGDDEAKVSPVHVNVQIGPRLRMKTVECFRGGFVAETLTPALGIAWKYALKTAPSLCLLKEKVTSITFPEEVSFRTGDQPGTGRPHHLRKGRHSRG